MSASATVVDATGHQIKRHALEVPQELLDVVAHLPDAGDLGAFVEVALQACAPPGCGGAFQAAWLPPDPGLLGQQGPMAPWPPDLLSQFVSASAAAVSRVEREQTSGPITLFGAVARGADELERERAKLEESDSLWSGLQAEADLRGICGEQPGRVLAGALAQWGMRRNPTGNVIGNEWPWVNPAASLPVYALVGAFLDEWNRSIIYAKQECGQYTGAHVRYARATADLTCALAALALTAQREHDHHTATTEHDRPERPWAAHVKTRKNEQQLATWLHLVWREAAGCMKEEQAACWKRVRYFYAFRISRGIETRPTHVQLTELGLRAHTHHCMMRVRSGAEAESPSSPSSPSSIDAVDPLRHNADGLSMAELAQLHFGDEASEEGERAAARDERSPKSLDNQWRICVARAEFDRLLLLGGAGAGAGAGAASPRYGRFARAQGWAPVETKDAQEIGMGLHTRYTCGNCASWAPRAPVCPGCRSVRFCSDKCRQEALGARTANFTGRANHLGHAAYCNGKAIDSLAVPDAADRARFFFPTALNIAGSHVDDAIRVLAEHGMSNLNVLVHCTRRIDVGRDDIGPKGAELLLAACTNAAAALRDREAMQSEHLLHWLPLFWALFAPRSKRPCQAAVDEMARTPRRFAAQFLELVVSWAPALLKAVEPLPTVGASPRRGAGAHEATRARNPTHNVPIYLLCTLWGVLRCEKRHECFASAFWDGMGQQLTKALIVVLLALEHHECHLEHNLRSLPDVVLRILHHLSATVKVQPTFQQVKRSMQAVEACGWSRLRSRLAGDWARSVRRELSRRPSTTFGQWEWASLIREIDAPPTEYYAAFAVAEGRAVGAEAALWELGGAHRSPDNFAALPTDPPDTLAADGDSEHEADQSDDDAPRAAARGPAPRAARRRTRRARAATAIQRAWRRARHVRRVRKAPAADVRKSWASDDGGAVEAPGGLAHLPYRPEEWIDIAGHGVDAHLQAAHAASKASHFGRGLDAVLAARPREAFSLA